MRILEGTSCLSLASEAAQFFLSKYRRKLVTEGNTMFITLSPLLSSASVIIFNKGGHLGDIVTLYIYPSEASSPNCIPFCLYLACPA